MSQPIYRLTPDDEDRFWISFSPHVTNVIGLRMAPDELEDVLLHDNWLVLVFSVWDSNDRPTIDIACKLADRLDGFKVAVRPFEFGHEFASWVPGFVSDAGRLQISESDGNVSIMTSSGDHPMWFLIQNGRFVSALVGARTEDVVIKFLTENSVLAAQGRRT